MLKRSSRHPTVRPSRAREPADGLLLLLAVLFLLGCLFGSLLGRSGAPAQWLSDVPAAGGQDAGFWQTFFLYAKYELAAYLLGTTYFGVAALPVLSVLKGCVYSRAAAALLSTGKNGLVDVLALQALPALLSVACFLVLSADGIRNARRLSGLLRGERTPPVKNRLVHALISLPLLFCGTAIYIYLVPALMTLFHK